MTGGARTEAACIEAAMAEQHLKAMSPERRAMLNAEWLAGEVNPIMSAAAHYAGLSDERRAELNAEWLP